MKNFLIVGTQRTGSSALGEIAGSHPKIACGWEWTQNGIFYNKIAVAEKALKGDFSVLCEEDRQHMKEVFHEGIEWLGFRRLFRSSSRWIIHPCLSPALIVDRFESHIKWLKKNSSVHVIHVVRTDNIDWLKSKYVSKENKKYWGEMYPDGVKVTIPVKEAIARIRSKEWIDKRLSTLQHSNPYLKIEYEGFLEDRNSVVKNLFNFLKCEFDNILIENTRLRKQSRGSIKEYIENYEELFTELVSRNMVKSYV